ncbi:cellulose-binding protein [Streptomyces minutiscleroticus]|nr:cellulose-binding protein [Streptomyces minutiscleroticus]
MSSPHGFASVRGRGYRPWQVDAYADALSHDRDAAWERAARLTVLAREMEEELARLREVVAGLPPQTYETLGGRARELFDLGMEEAAEVRAHAQREARDTVAGAEEAARRTEDDARAAADAVRERAEAYARQRLLEARAEADALRAAARRDAKELSGAALEEWRGARRRGEELLAVQEKEQAGREELLAREVADREAALDARYEQLRTAAEADLAAEERALAEAGEWARHHQEEAEARAAAVLAEARLHEERTVRETERVLREHGERWDTVRAHMDHVRESLAALTGRVAAADPETGRAPVDPADPEAGPLPVDPEAGPVPVDPEAGHTPAEPE